MLHPMCIIIQRRERASIHPKCIIADRDQHIPHTVSLTPASEHAASHAITHKNGYIGRITCEHRQRLRYIPPEHCRRALARPHGAGIANRINAPDPHYQSRISAHATCISITDGHLYILHASIPHAFASATQSG